ncbi:SDR family NAD(P)-dependent oxidoreductase [Candidatus Cloacimonadota bacterium]
MKSFLLNGKNALVTGASKGIGAEIARIFAQAGADVCIIGRNMEGLLQTKIQVENFNNECYIIEEDISTVEGARSAGNKALKISPRWDILVNNAGIAFVSPILEISEEEWTDTFAINLQATLVLSQIIVPEMIKIKKGKIVNISSLGAFFGTPGFGSYAASKAALNQLTRTMAVEWGPYNIQVNAVCPTIILTDKGKQIWNHPDMKTKKLEKENRIPLHRFGTPTDVANACLFFASSAADFVSGVSLPLDGGMSISP